MLGHSGETEHLGKADVKGCLAIHRMGGSRLGGVSLRGLPGESVWLLLSTACYGEGGR